VKKVFVLLLAVITASAFAQELTISGEAKGGVYWEKIQDRAGTENSLKEIVRLGSVDDAGSDYGRFRLNLDYLNASGILGFKVRFNWDDYLKGNPNGPEWAYAFGFGNFFNDQLTLSLGKLGSSPWGTGGPEMWKELEIAPRGGIRFEYKPAFIPSNAGKLNVGFVLNWVDDVDEAAQGGKEATLLDLLQETVVGVSYTHEYFMVRGAYRFDSKLDNAAGRSGQDIEVEGTKLVYRVEEYALRRLLPGLSIWALGNFQGLGSSNPEYCFKTVNWLFIQYAPQAFTAQIRLGLDAADNRTVFFTRPSFAYNLFDGLLVPSIIGAIAWDVGEFKVYADEPFSYIEFEPKLQVNFAPGAYAAFSYYYRLEYKFPSFPPEQTKQYMNLRFGISF